MSQNRYHIKGRGITWGGKKNKPEPELCAIQITANPYSIRAAIDEVFLPRVGSHLSKLKPEDFAPWIRSCEWSNCVNPADVEMKYPRAIIPFLDVTDLPIEGKKMLEDARLAERSETEFIQIGKFEGTDPAELSLRTLFGKIAALGLFEKSPWGESNRADIFEEALQDREMTYFFVCSVTPLREEWIKVVASVGNNARIAYAILRLKHFSYTQLDARQCLERIVGNSSLFKFAYEVGKFGINHDKLCRETLSLETTDTDTALIQLILGRSHHDVQGCLEVLHSSPLMAFRARRLLHLINQGDQNELTKTLGIIAMCDPYSAFLWVRLFGNGDENVVRSIDPRLEWISELLSLGLVDPSFALNTGWNTEEIQIDDTHWLKSSLILHAANILQNEKD